MKQTDNALRTQALLLAMKALDVISKALDIIAADDGDNATNVVGGSPADTEPLADIDRQSADISVVQPDLESGCSDYKDLQSDGGIINANTQSGRIANPPERTLAPSAPVAPSAPNVAPSAPDAPKVSSAAPSVPKPSSPDTYRADAIRFNEQFLHDHYDLRYNTMKKTTEFRPKASIHPDSVIPPLPLRGGVGGEAFGGEASWLPLTDRDLNAITVGQLLAGGQSWSYGMKLCIDSSRVASFDPVAHYLNHLPAWDGHDHIADLAARVPTAYKEWPTLFRRWLLAMVAQARGMSADHGNALVPMLIGAQGTGKSTFCKMLLPRQLRQYYMDDIKMDNAEQVERVLGRMWLVNIDEYDSKTQREQAKIKRLLTERDVQVRRPRSDQYTLVRRVCSFIATTNDRRPLCDPTGSRRYLCVELDGAIDTLMTTSDIEELLAAHGLRPQDMPSPRQLTAALRTAGIRQGAQQGRHGWYATAVRNIVNSE